MALTFRANCNRFRSHGLHLFVGATYRPTELTRRLNSSILLGQYHNNIQKEYKLINLHFMQVRLVSKLD